MAPDACRIVSLPARWRSEHTSHNLLNVSASRLHEREDDLQAASDKLGRLLVEARLRVSRVSARVTTSGNEATAAGTGRQPRALQLAADRGVSFWTSPSIGPNRSEVLAFLRGSGVALPSAERNRPRADPGTGRESRVSTAEGTGVDHRSAGQRTALPHAISLAAGLRQPGGRRSPPAPRDPREDRHRENDLASESARGRHPSRTWSRVHRAARRPGRLAFGVDSAEPHERRGAVRRRRRLHPLSFNLLACNDEAQRPLVASGIVSAFKKIYGTMWGPRLEHILRNALLALLEIPGSSLVQILPLLGDDDYREGVMQHVSDPAVRRFWEREFADMPARLRGEAISPVLNKIGHFISSPLAQKHCRSAARARSTCGRSWTKDGILIVNLSKGKVGSDASELLGALLVTALQLAAMSRADTRGRGATRFLRLHR